MRVRRIIIIIATSVLSSIAASANPFIEADPSVQRGAALQLSKQFGGLRGSITVDDIPVATHMDIDPVRTQSVSRSMTPGQWLSARSMLVQQDKAEAATNQMNDAVTTPEKPKAVPLEQVDRPVRIVYINNAPL